MWRVVWQKAGSKCSLWCFLEGGLLRMWNEKYLTRKIRLPGKSMLCVIIARHLSVWWQKWSCRKKSQCHWSTPFPGFLLLTNQANRTLVELAFLGVEKKWLDVVLSFNGFVGVLTWFTTQAFFHPLFSYPSDIKTSKWQKHTWWNTLRTIRTCRSTPALCSRQNFGASELNQCCLEKL